jgi:hypothetical protein
LFARTKLTLLKVFVQYIITTNNHPKDGHAQRCRVLQ